MGIRIMLNKVRETNAMSGERIFLGETRTNVTNEKRETKNGAHVQRK